MRACLSEGRTACFRHRDEPSALSNDANLGDFFLCREFITHTQRIVMPARFAPYSYGKGSLIDDSVDDSPRLGTSTQQADDGSPRNHLLASLSPETYARLASKLERISLPAQTPIYGRGEELEQVYFPERGVISVVCATANHAMVEVNTIGNDGFSGVPVVLGTDSGLTRAVVQVQIDAHRISAAALRDEISTNQQLASLLLRYVQTAFDQVGQSMACTRSHNIDERCARWLLMTHDRAGADKFFLTQDFLAQMLAVRRPSVTTAAATLARAGLIRYSRGMITVLDKAGLEAASCECYAQICAAYNRILGVPARMSCLSPRQ